MSQKSSQNHCFLEEAGDYLEANGYQRSEGKLVDNALYFLKDGNGVVIYGDNVDFMVSTEEEPGQRRAGFVRHMALAGIAGLDIFKWMLLFHVTDTVPLQGFIKTATKGKAQVDMLGELASHFIPNEGMSERVYEKIVDGIENKKHYLQPHP